MAITLRAVGTVATQAAGVGTTMNVPYPTPGGGIAAGDLLVYVAFNNNTTSPANPTGFTTGISQNSGASTPSLKIAYKLAVGGETGNLSCTFPGSNTQKAVLLCFDGVDQTTPIDVTGTTFGNASADSTIDVPTLTTTTTGVALVGGATTNNATSTWTSPSAPAAWTEDFDTATNISATAGHLIWSGSGATGTMTFTQSGSVRCCGGVIAIRPAASGSAVSADAALTGTATLAATGQNSAVAGAASSTTATLAGTAAVLRPADGSRAVTATLTGTAAVTRPASGALTGTATLTATAAVDRPAAAALSVTATLGSTATVLRPVDASLPTTATLTATATVTPAGGSAVSADGVLTATGTLTGTAAVNRAAAGALVATSTQVGTAAVLRPASAALTGTVTFTATATVTGPVAETIPGTMTPRDGTAPTMVPLEAPCPAMDPTPVSPAVFPGENIYPEADLYSGSEQAPAMMSLDVAGPRMRPRELVGATMGST